MGSANAATRHARGPEPLGPESFDPELTTEGLKAEGLEVEWRFRVIHERNALLSMEMSFFDSVPGPDLAHKA